jgi:hypothetical protein
VWRKLHGGFLFARPKPGSDRKKRFENSGIEPWGKAYRTDRNLFP